jgi:hypothetical protein
MEGSRDAGRGRRLGRQTPISALESFARFAFRLNGACTPAIGDPALPTAVRQPGTLQSDSAGH